MVYKSIIGDYFVLLKRRGHYFYITIEDVPIIIKKLGEYVSTEDQEDE